jgi:hypothetical protein
MPDSVASIATVNLASLQLLLACAISRYMLRVSRAPRTGSPSRWGRPGYVVWPALIGLGLCVLAIFGYRLEASNNADFVSHSAKAMATIDSFYYGPEVVGTGNTPWFTEYATVHFWAAGRTVTANVTLVPKCNGTCVPPYKVGGQIRLAYDIRQVSDAVYPVPKGRLSLNPLAWNSLVSFAAAVGIGSLIVAVLNMSLGTTAPVPSRRTRKRNPAIPNKVTRKLLHWLSGQSARTH